MKPRSIGQLALLYLSLFTLMMLAMGVYFWHEIGQTNFQLQEQAARTARVELAEAMEAVGRQAHTLGENLATWDETKQQLVFPEYYALWRDNRVRDAGLLPPSVIAVALYDKAGNILIDPAGKTTPMPRHLPFPPPATLLKNEAGQGYLYEFLPVHADPGHSVLLGYLGLKMPLRDALARIRAYRYANLDSLEMALPAQAMVEASRAMEVLLVNAHPSPEQKELQHLLQHSVARLSLAVLLGLLLAAWWLNRLMVRPLRRLSAEIDALDDPDGDLHAQRLDLQPLRVLELENVRRSFNDYQHRLAELHRNLEQSNRDFFDQARRDALTGAFNRRAFEEDWRGLGQSGRHEELALILFDCDHFKAINDTYGHNVGDAVIATIAHRLQHALRTDDRLYRIGGDEFATLISKTDTLHAQTVAERCLEQVMSHDFHPYGLTEPVTISIGVALILGETGERERITLSELQKRADLAMYAAKRPGGQKIMFYSPQTEDMKSLVANSAINAVFQAIQNPELIEMAYQAVVRLPLLRHEYSEALARIRFNDTLIQAEAIFPIVQARNLDAEFDLAVIRAIRRDSDTGRLPEGKGVSINISGPGIVNARVIDALLTLLATESKRKIVVEITETALITQMETASQNIQRLRAAGALAALDDFGSGYSSLRYLASMPVDLVKFDISMVQLLETGQPRQKLIVQEIAYMVITAGYELVAEGIESASLLDQVIRLGFSHAQGYYFGKPGEAVAHVHKGALTPPK